MSLLVFAVGFLFFALRRSLRYLHFLQQEEYMSGRFLSWILQHKAWDKRGTTLAFVGALAGVPWEVMGFAFLLLGFLEQDPRKSAKVPLRMTARAQRIFRLHCGFLLLTFLGFLAAASLWTSLAFIQIIPLLLTLSTTLLWPQEQKLQNRFIAEAKARLAEVNPFVIGITGSYGKTSTKHALGELLQITLGPTFWPSKGINTPMGNVREIRERLISGYKYAVMEMGAYGKGSIARLCDLTPPHAAIITAVGVAHLERFGSKENILNTKAELAEALPEDGILVVNADDEGASKIAERHPNKRRYFYGRKEFCDCRLLNCSIIDGTSHFTLRWKGKDYRGSSLWLGDAAISNLMAAFTLSCVLGADPEYVIAAMRNIVPVKNRLEFEKGEHYSILHDAYNSNPTGFKAAVDVMEQMSAPRKILMTPGMIELGDAQDALNRSVAAHAAKTCQRVYVVGECNRESLIAGLREGGLEENAIITCTDREQAFAHMAAEREEGDLVLIENDLNDLYEPPKAF